MKTIQLKTMLLAIAGMFFFSTQSFAQVTVYNYTFSDLDMEVDMGDESTCTESASYVGSVSAWSSTQINATTLDVLEAWAAPNWMDCLSYVWGHTEAACRGGNVTIGNAPCVGKFKIEISGNNIYIRRV